MRRRKRQKEKRKKKNEERQYKFISLLQYNFTVFKRTAISALSGGKRKSLLLMTMTINAVMCLGFLLNKQEQIMDSRPIKPYYCYLKNLEKPSSNKNPLSSIYGNVTIITAYLDLGKFPKGESDNYFTPQMYHEWASVFEYIVNPLVVYTDSAEFYELIREMRQNMTSRTKIHLIKRVDLWSFEFLPSIQKLYASLFYPNHYPNTVIPEYPCVQHAKYELTARAAATNSFNTSHFAWVDVGYFRDIVDQKRYFRLDAPSDLESDRLGFTIVERRDLRTPIKDIFKKNIYWVGGGLFVGTQSTISAYEEQYKRAVNIFLGRSLMNSDQQILFGTYSFEGRPLVKPEIELQLYGEGCKYWFYLGYKMINYL